MASKRSKNPSSALASAGTNGAALPEPLRSTAGTHLDSALLSTTDVPPDSALLSTADVPPDSPPDDTTPKLPPAAWKTGEQLEYMQSKTQLYFSHQNEGTLDRFWPRIFDHWQRTWEIDPPAKAIKKHGSRENAILVLRSETFVRVRAWFHNFGRATSKPPTVKSDLRLNQSEKRMLAPLQAYCSYAWDSGLREKVIEKWEEQKKTYMSMDEDDPTIHSANGPGSHIPIAFKLKVAKEVYNKLSKEQKKAINDRREEERKKLYKSIPEIKDIEERNKKLRAHKNNQPSVSKSLLRVLKNLEDQAGCVAQLFVAHVDPDTGETHCEQLCQGKTESGLDFQTFSGNDFDKVIEKEFREWALGVFGDLGSKRRATFMISDVPPNEQQASSSSVQLPPIPHATAIEQFNSLPSGIDATFVTEDEIIGAPSIAPLPQVPERMQVVPAETLIRPALLNQPSIPNPGIVPPQVSEPPKSVEPQEVFTHDQSEDLPFVAHPALHESPLATPPVFNHFPIVHESPSVTSSPVLVSSQVISPTAAEPLHLFPHPVLGSSQVLAPSQVVAAPAEGITSGNPGAMVTTTSSDNLPHTVTTTSSTPIRRDSIDGAPDVILTLTSSGYRLSPLQESLITPMESAFATPSTPFPDDLNIPSSQQSLEEYLTIPLETAMNIPPHDLIIRSSHPSLEDPSTVSTEPGTSTMPSPVSFAPRIIPDYDIDRSDLPSWLLERGRLDFVLSVEAGGLWKNLITLWLRQERRAGFGLSEQLGARLSLKEKPDILKDYFKWHHTPSKGDSVTLPTFGDEMSAWWGSLQPTWRYKDEQSSIGRNDYSYILAGGKKGLYLFILCLAWWDRAYGRGMEAEKVRRRNAARVAGKEDTTLTFDDLREHDCKWFNILNDLIFVMEHAQSWPVPGDGTHAAAVTPVRKKRAAERDEGSSPRKKSKSKSS